MSLKLVVIDGHYRVHGTLAGVRVRESTRVPAKKRLKPQAERVLRYIEEEVLNGTYKHGQRNKKRTIHDAIDDYLSSANERTNGGYYLLREFDRLHGDTLLTVANPDIVQDFIESFFKSGSAWRVKPQTIRRELSPLKAIWATEHQAGNIKRPLFLKIPKTKKKKHSFLTKEEVRTVIDNEPAVVEPLFTFMVYTGARETEAFDLEWTDVDLKRKTVILTTRKGSGDDRQRRVPLNDELIEKLKALPHRTGHVFRNAYGKPYAGNKFAAHSTWLHWKKLIDDHGITSSGGKKILRHTFASHLAIGGIDIQVLAELMGHENINQTMEYRHLMPSKHHSAIDDLEF